MHHQAPTDADVALAVTAQLLNNMAWHDNSNLRARTVHTFVYPIVQDEFRRNRMVDQDRALFAEVIPPLIDALGPTTKSFSEQQLEDFQVTLVNMHRKLIAGEISPFDLHVTEEIGQYYMERDQWLPWRVRLALSAREYRGAALKLMATWQLLKLSRLKGQFHYKCQHTQSEILTVSYV